MELKDKRIFAITSSNEYKTVFVIPINIYGYDNFPLIIFNISNITNIIRNNKLIAIEIK